MAHIAAFSLPVPGHLFPLLPILDAVQDRGHGVSLALCSPGTMPATVNGIRSRGVAWCGAPEERDAAARPTFHSFLSPSYFAAFGESLAEGYGAVLEAERPDFVLVDPKLWGAMVAAEASPVPWASVAHNPLYIRGTGVDPRGPGLPPATGWPSRIRHRIVEAVIGLETEVHLREVNRVRATRSLNPLKRVSDLFSLPTLILATTAEPFEYPRSDWPTGLEFVGPMICDPAGGGMDVPNPSDGRPLVLVSGSTIPAGSSAAHWADTVLRALSSEPYRVLAMLPTERVQSDTSAGRASDGLRSHSAVLPHVSCVVCPGGAGTVHKALWFGVPVVAIPFALDRYEVARRVEVAGAGVSLPLKDLTPESVRVAVRRALECSRGAETVMHQLRAAGGPQRAADLIEARLGSAKLNPQPSRFDPRERLLTTMVSSTSAITESGSTEF